MSSSFLSLASSSFGLNVDVASGGVFGLFNQGDSFNTNYVINATMQSQFNVRDSRWLGDLIFNVRPAGSTAAGTTMVSGLSGDVRKVTKGPGNSINVDYTGNAADANGFKGFNVKQIWNADDKDVLVWSNTVLNTGSQALEFMDVGFPLLFNGYWAADQTTIYEKGVGRHSHTALDGSYIYYQRPNGEGPYLLMTPGNGTSLEFKNKARYGEGPFAEVDPKWEGVVEYYANSKNVQPARVNQAVSYLPATSSVIPAGGNKTFSFQFRWPKDYQGLRDALYASGGLDTVSLPGMTIPTDSKATLSLRANGGIQSVVGETGKNIQIVSQGSKNGYNIYQVTLPTIGPNKITVTYGGGRKKSVLQYSAIRPVEQLISQRASFVVNNHQAKTTRGYNGAYLQYDMSAKKQIAWDGYTGGGWKQWMAGGSDDLGHGPATFLSEKQTIKPVQAEIASVDYYITNFLFKYLQNKQVNGARSYEVYRWFDGQDGVPSDTGTWRVYNYVHIANTYFNMYRTAKNFPGLTYAYAPGDYLTFCYETLNAMFSKVELPTPIGPDPAVQFGLMGEMTYPDILATLNSEGRGAQATRLDGFLRNKFKYFSAEKYPFASEASIDTTGFESVYTLAKMYGDQGLKDKVQKASAACRGLQPLWYFYGGDNRHMGESWWNLGYETQLGAWQQQEYLLDSTTAMGSDRPDMTRQTYGAYLAGWNNINSGQINGDSATFGAASWQFASEGGAQANYDWIPLRNGWWAWSGEVDLGLWGGLRSASASVVSDPIVGNYAYNADLTESADSFSVIPKDGVRQRLVFMNLGNLDIRIGNVVYNSAVVKKDATSISMVLAPVSDKAVSTTIAVARLPAGNYNVSLGGAVVGQMRSDGQSAKIAVKGVTSGTPTLSITKV